MPATSKAQPPTTVKLMPRNGFVATDFVAIDTVPQMTDCDTTHMEQSPRDLAFPRSSVFDKRCFSIFRIVCFYARLNRHEVMDLSWCTEYCEVE